MTWKSVENWFQFFQQKKDTSPVEPQSRHLMKTRGSIAARAQEHFFSAAITITIRKSHETGNAASMNATLRPPQTHFLQIRAERERERKRNATQTIKTTEKAPQLNTNLREIKNKNKQTNKQTNKQIKKRLA